MSIFLFAREGAELTGLQWYQLHLLLRHHILPKFRNWQPFRHHHDYFCRKHGLHRPRIVFGRKLGPQAALICWSGWYVCVAASRCRDWYSSAGPESSESGSRCLRVHIYVSCSAECELRCLLIPGSAFFASTWGPCAWVVTGEIFPLKARAKGLSITTASNWLLNTIIAVVTPYMVNAPANLHARVFFIWGGFCVICAFFVWSMIYETKGLALESVDELYAKVAHAWQSKGKIRTCDAFLRHILIMVPFEI